MILNGRKTWEIRSMRTDKRERVSLSPSGTALLLGDVEIVGCIDLDAAKFDANVDKHCVPPHSREEVVGQYKKIVAWELARPRRYFTPIIYTREQGQVKWIDLQKQEIFLNFFIMI